MIADLCFFAAFNTDFVTEKSYQELALYAFGTVAVTGIQSFAAYLLLRSHYMSVAFDRTCKQFIASLQLPQYHTRVPTKRIELASSIGCHASGSRGRGYGEIGVVEEGDAADLGMVDMTKMFEDQSYILRGMGPLDRFLETEDDTPVGWGLRAHQTS
jgi:hypothetical protein